MTDSLPLRGRALLLAVAGLAAPLTALAQWSADPYIDMHFEHDSNVFRAENSTTLFQANGGTQLGDSDEKYVVGTDSDYLWSEQKLHLNLEARRFEYDHYSDLDHNEYNADLAFDWRLTSLFDGIIEARQRQDMAPFYIGNSTGLTLDVDRYFNALANLHISPSWVMQAGADWNDLKDPLQLYPDARSRDFGEHLELDNLSVTNLSYGVSLDHLNGEYTNAPNAGPFSQSTAQLTAKYTVSTLTMLNAGLGYTRRTQYGNAGNLSGIAAVLRYTRQLTAKTSVMVDFSRQINNYVAAAGSELDLSGRVTLDYHLTYKITIEAIGGYVRSSFAGQSVFGAAATDGRVDKSPLGSLDVNYAVLKRLSVHAYFNKQTRSSNYAYYDFNDSIVGIEAKLSWR